MFLTGGTRRSDKRTRLTPNKQMCNSNCLFSRVEVEVRGKSQLKDPRGTGHIGSQQNINKNRCAWRTRSVMTSGGTHSVP